MRMAMMSDALSISNLMNKAYRGDSARKGWTHEADLIGGIRTDEEQVKEIISSNHGSYHLMEEEGRLMALVFLQPKGNSLYLGSLTVDPDLQANGIGRKLLEYAEEVAVDQKLGKIKMTVITNRIELIAWYERRGYINTLIKEPFPMGNPKFGEPKEFLEFFVLEKDLIK
jgi:N-acetylglutamate synthase-like GNAT family acetyltransferase